MKKQIKKKQKETEKPKKEIARQNAVAKESGKRRERRRVKNLCGRVGNSLIYKWKIKDLWPRLVYLTNNFPHVM